MKTEKLEIILKELADTEEIRNYEIKLHTNDFGGDGYLSECQTGEIINKDTGSKIQVFIKISLPMLGQFTSWAYSNEYHFYTYIFPELNKFQIARGVKVKFQNWPKFYYGNDKEDEKYLALEDLKSQDYVMIDKTQAMSEDHIKVLFETYGRFHALSFAFKDYNLEKYSELTKPLVDLIVPKEASPIMGAAKITFKVATNAVKEINQELAKRFDKINENFEETFAAVATYKGNYSGLSHGDCWSNNMLFKYWETKNVKDVKIIDFQLCRDSTPVHDLSYFFYSGASKQDFKKLDEYLQLYHNSFSTFAKELGCDPEKLLPFSSLKADWKKYSLMGIFMAVVLWSSKLATKESIEKYSSSTEETKKSDFISVIRTATYKKNTSDILLHAAEYGIV